MSTTTKDKIAIEDAEVSYYINAWGDNDSQAFLTTHEWLEGTALGTWKEHVLNARKHLGDKEAYSKIKKNGPGVTPGARFIHRKKGSEISYTTLMVIDLDHLDDDRQSVKALMKLDPYVYAVFDSIGGEGLCLLFRVDVSRWDESFLGIQEYLGKKYGLFEKFDPSGKDISRLRFVSYDPDMLVKSVLVPVFKEYPKKEPKRKPIPETFIHTQEDFDYVFQQVCDSGVDITPYYAQRLKVCFALIDKFGDNGWPYFNRICQNHAEYDEKKAERMWKSAMGYGAQKVTIKTFYYFCKEAQLDIARPMTREVTSIAAAHKKQGGSVAGTVETLKKMKDLDPAETESIVRQVFDCKQEFKTDETLFDQIEMFLRGNYDLHYNEITHYIENSGIKLLDRELLDVYIATAKAFDMGVSKDNVYSLLLSGFVPAYHPIKSFFNQNRHRRPDVVIEALSNTIKSDMGGINYVGFFLRKFLVGMISTVYGEQCPLVPILTGPPNTGKTQFWRRLLPKELRDYYAESKFAKDGDDEMLMCKKIFLMNDDFDNAFLAKHARFKSLTDKNTFSIRKPYSKAHEDIARLAVIAGTSNEDNLLSDPTGNRRIIPINVLSIDHAAYNAIDKTDLIMEAYWAYMDGERCDLTNENIAQLEKHTSRFVDVSIEHDMVDKYFEVPTIKEDSMLWSQGEILQYLTQMTGIKNLRPKLISQEMKHLGFPYSDKEWYPAEKKAKRGFWLYKRSLTDSLL